MWGGTGAPRCNPQKHVEDVWKRFGGPKESDLVMITPCSLNVPSWPDRVAASSTWKTDSLKVSVRPLPAEFGIPNRELPADILQSKQAEGPERYG